MPIPLPLETARLLIRPFEPAADAADMFAVYGDPEVMRYIPDGTYARVEDVQSRLAQETENQRRRGFASWAVVLRETGRVIGDCGFGVLEATGDVEMGWTLARDMWHAGYAAEAAATCLAAAHAHLDVPRIVAAVDSRNEPSLRLARRLGMRELARTTLHGTPHVLFEAEH